MHGVVDVVQLPYLTAQSLTHRISLIVVGTPSMPDKGAPLRHRAVDSFAIAKAAQFVRVSEKSSVHHYPYVHPRLSASNAPARMMVGEIDGKSRGAAVS